MRKNAIVSGGSSGIGRAICIDLAKRGCNVIFTYRNSLNESLVLIEEIMHDYKVEAMAVKCDMTDVEQVKGFWKQVKKHYDKIDIVVNNVGTTGEMQLFIMSDLTKWINTLLANVNSVINLTKTILPTMIRQKSGRIINITSLGGITGNPGYSAYASAKAAIYSFTKSLQKEVAQFGIILNCVAPGLISTKMTSNVSDKYQTKRFENSIIKRMGNPEEVSNLVTYLALEAPDYIVNQEIIIDGGVRG